MYGGRTRARDSAPAQGRRRGPARLGLSAGLIAVATAVVVTGGHQPSQDLLATAPVPLSDQDAGTASDTTTPLTPPVRLPDPSGRQVQGPASPAQTGPLASSASVAGIPPVALTAYQRSAVVINAADPSCHLDWTLLAAIGQVESDHGQVGGSSLNAHGVAHPAIIGPRLDGRHGTSLVRDTDAGRLDGDRRFDHAVGPMQFLPSTWAAVAVDGDDDGRRDVQDINDAALGSAVYLCADHDDLATGAGRHAALLRYNHSQAYVAHVLAIARVLDSTALVPSTDVSVRSIAFTHVDRTPQPGRHHRQRHQHHSQISPTADPSLDPSSHGPVSTDPIPPTSTPDPTPIPDPTPTPDPTPDPTPTPTDPGDPAEPPVIPDPLPPALADLTPDQVEADNAAWAACDDDLTSGWSTVPATLDSLTQCLADQESVPTDDPGLTTFIDWLVTAQDPLTD